MLGRTNATTSSGGGGSGDKIYGIKLAYEYMQSLLDNSVKKTDAICLNVLSRGGNPVGLFGNWTYKPADLSEYMQDILTGDNVAASLVLSKVIGGISVRDKDRNMVV